MTARLAIVPPPECGRAPREVRVTRVNADRSVRAWVNGSMQTVTVERLGRWIDAGVNIAPIGGWTP